MGVAPDDFRTHADRIFNDYGDEISRRCAISRGYYYAFLYTRKKGSQHPQGNFVYGAGDHGNARDFCREIGGKSLSKQLNGLHEERKKADYELSINVEVIDVKKFRSDLNNFISDLTNSL